MRKSLSHLIVGRRVAWTYLSLPLILFTHPTLNTILLGATISILGLGIRFWAVGFLQKNKFLVVAGPYAYTRNPMYLGSFFMGLGIATATGAWWFLLAFLGFFLFVFSVTMRSESKELSRLFPEEYRQFEDRVPMFFPRFKFMNQGNRDADVYQFSLIFKNREYRAWLAWLGFFGIICFKAYLDKIGFHEFPFLQADFFIANWVKSFEEPWLKKLAVNLSYLGNGVFLAILSLTLAGLGWWRKKPTLQTAGIQALLAFLLAGLSSQILKHLFGRARPRILLEAGFHLLGPTLQSGFDSFPSGHALTTFAVATALAKNFSKGAWIFYLLASLIAVSRVLSGSHFPTDVIAGALLGILMGKLVLWALKRRDFP